VKKKKAKSSDTHTDKTQPKVRPPLPVYDMGRPLVNVADRNALENAMRPDERSRYREDSTN
jgi:hypothetical protein